MATGLLSCLSVQAGNEVVAPAVEAPASSATGLLVGKFPGETIYDRIWSGFTLYENKTNPFLQKLAITGRFQYDYANVNGSGTLPKQAGSQDLSYDEFNVRRFRAGLKATVLKDVTLHAEGDFDIDNDPDYLRLTDAYVGWKAHKAAEIKVGKQGVAFTLDGSTSSKELLTLDRNNLTNNLWFTYEYLPGVTVGGKSGDWVYNFGVFSQGDEDKEFGEFNAGTAWLATIGYDFSKCLSSKEALLTLNYVYNDETDPKPALFSNRSLGQVVSLNFRYAQEKFGVFTDVAYGDGYLKQSDIFGLNVTPYYNITDKLQGVMRYTYLNSGDDNGIRFTNYDSAVLASAKADEYQEVYAGLNYYIYGNKLKLQTGLSYISAQDAANDGGAFDGLSWITGLRIAW